MWLRVGLFIYIWSFQWVGHIQDVLVMFNIKEKPNIWIKEDPSSKSHPTPAESIKTLIKDAITISYILWFHSNKETEKKLSINAHETCLRQTKCDENKYSLIEFLPFTCSRPEINSSSRKSLRPAARNSKPARLEVLKCRWSAVWTDASTVCRWM